MPMGVSMSMIMALMAVRVAVMPQDEEVEGIHHHADQRQECHHCMPHQHHHQ